MKHLKPSILIIFIILLLLAIQLRAYYFKRQLSESGEFTIGKIDSIIEMPKLTNIYVSYYSDKIKFVTPERKKINNISQKDVGKFYELKFLKSNPKIARTNFSKQVTDTSAIFKAGFSREDIKK